MSNKFNHKNKITKLKFNDINDLINDIKNNTISEALAKQKLNALNEINKAETKKKRLINGQKILLNLFDDFVEEIFNNNEIVNKGNKKIVNKDNNKILNKDNNKIVNKDNNETVNKDNNETVNKDNNKIVNEDNNVNDDNNDHDDDNDDDDHDITVKGINNNFQKVNETKSFEDQIDILKKYHG